MDTVKARHDFSNSIIELKSLIRDEHTLQLLDLIWHYANENKFYVAQSLIIAFKHTIVDEDLKSLREKLTDFSDKLYDQVSDLYEGIFWETYK